MAHFLEHMIFKGTAELAPGVFDREIENCGGMANAATSYDYAHYFLTTAAPYLENTLPLLAELLLNAAIPADEFIRERDVVLEEIRQADDDPDCLGFQALARNVYQGHPYGQSILGTERELMQQSPEAMRCFHRTHYQPDNMTVVIVGGIAQEPALELVNRTFVKNNREAPIPDECPQVEAVGTLLGERPSENFPSEIRRQELRLPRLEQARLFMAWTGPGVNQLRSAYGLDLISVLLAEGRSSRLVQELREQQLVQRISSNFSLQRDMSLFTISAWLQPEELERVESLICTHLYELQTKPVSQRELARCQRILCNDYAFSTETPNQLASLYGYYGTIAEAELAIAYPEQIQSLQVEDIQRLAQQYLSPHQYAVTVLK